MSDALVTQWKDRVIEAESEVQVILDEINSIVSNKEQLTKDIDKYQTLVQKEKQQLLKKLEAAQKRAEDFEKQCETLNKEKDRVEAIYHQTLDEYESFHEVVKAIKQHEAMLEGRADLEKLLQTESINWAEEEHQLRSRINHLDAQVKNTKRSNAQELAQAEAKLKEAEGRLHSERMGRENNNSSNTSSGFSSRLQQQQQSAPNSRAASVASSFSSKAGSRKRDLLGDVTNA